jgi:hypothetical protein
VKPRGERSAEEFLLEILYDSAEDLTGVFEVRLAADNWYPDWPAGRRLQLAEDTLLRLLAEGLITLWYWPTLDHPGRAMPLEEARSVLREWRTWFIPKGVEVWLFATDEGRARYPGADTSKGYDLASDEAFEAAQDLGLARS